MAARRPQEAGHELRRALELGPAVPITWVSYVQYLVRVNRVEQAKTVLVAARKALPANRANLATWLNATRRNWEHRAGPRRPSRRPSVPSCDLTTIRVATDLYINLGRFDLVDPILDKLRSPAIKATPEVLAWARRTRGLALVSTGRLAEMGRALDLVELNLKATPNSLDDLRLKAVILGLRTSRRGEAIKLLEPLDGSNQLGTDDQFLLAKIYLAERLVDKYRGQMIKILAGGAKNPVHIVHLVYFLIGRQELEQADHWIAELKKVALDRRICSSSRPGRSRPETGTASCLSCSRPVRDRIQTRSGPSPACSTVSASPRKPRRPTSPSSPVNPTSRSEPSAWPRSWPGRTGRKRPSRSSTKPERPVVPRRWRGRPWHFISRPPPTTTSNVGSRPGFPPPQGEPRRGFAASHQAGQYLPHAKAIR